MPALRVVPGSAWLVAESVSCLHRLSRRHGERGRFSRFTRLGRILLAHAPGHEALKHCSDLLADAALRWRGAELARETEVVPFSPRLDDLAVLPVVDADAGHRPAGPGRCQ